MLLAAGGQEHSAWSLVGELAAAEWRQRLERGVRHERSTGSGAVVAHLRAAGRPGGRPRGNVSRQGGRPTCQRGHRASAASHRTGRSRLSAAGVRGPAPTCISEGAARHQGRRLVAAGGIGSAALHAIVAGVRRPVWIIPLLVGLGTAGSVWLLGALSLSLMMLAHSGELPPLAAQTLGGPGDGLADSSGRLFGAATASLSQRPE